MTISPTTPPINTQFASPRLARARYEAIITRPRSPRAYKATALRLRMAAVFAHLDNQPGVAQGLLDRAHDCLCLAQRAEARMQSLVECLAGISAVLGHDSEGN